MAGMCVEFRNGLREIQAVKSEMGFSQILAEIQKGQDRTSHNVNLNVDFSQVLEEIHKVKAEVDFSEVVAEIKRVRADLDFSPMFNLIREMQMSAVSSNTSFQ